MKSRTNKKDKSQQELTWYRILFAGLIIIAVIGFSIFASILLAAIPFRSRRNNVEPDALHLDNHQCIHDYRKIMGDETANLAFLGENHDRRNSAIEVLEELTRNKGEHIVYLECTPRDLIVNCSGYSIAEKPGRTCMGWENPELISQTYADDRTLAMSHSYKDVYEIYQKDTSPWADTTARLFASMHVYGNMLENEMKNIGVADRNILNMIIHDPHRPVRSAVELLYAYKAVEEMIYLNINENMSFEKIFDLKKSLLEFKRTRYFLYERNVELANVALTRDKRKYGVFIAGSAHAVDDGHDWTEGARYLHKNLDKAGEKYVVYADSQATSVLNFFRHDPRYKSCKSGEKTQFTHENRITR